MDVMMGMYIGGVLSQSVGLYNQIMTALGAGAWRTNIP